MYRHTAICQYLFDNGNNFDKMNAVGRNEHEGAGR